MKLLINTTVVYSGSLFDKPVTGGEVGELNANIIGRQFRSLKFGDRFFFSHRRTSTVPGLHPTLRQNIFKYFLVLRVLQ